MTRWLYVPLTPKLLETVPGIQIQGLPSKPLLIVARFVSDHCSSPVGLFILPKISPSMFLKNPLPLYLSVALGCRSTLTCPGWIISLVIKNPSASVSNLSSSGSLAQMWLSSYGPCLSYSLAQSSVLPNVGLSSLSPPGVPPPPFSYGIYSRSGGVQITPIK